MSRILIFGNSGSGKSTLARLLCAAKNLPHLDLDTLAWEETVPPERTPLSVSIREIQRFMHANDGWVIEGCYADLLVAALSSSTEVIFMKLPIELCITNARARPWEPHKYESKEAQDANLEMLIDWISQYSERTDTFSEQAHQALYDAFQGKKTIYVSNERSTE